MKGMMGSSGTLRVPSAPIVILSGMSGSVSALRALHEGPEPLVLANAWDAASAKLVEELGFPAVATTSGGVAQALGFEDGERMPADEAFGAVRRIAAAVTVPVTADMEAGYGLAPEELAARLLEAGAVGLNFEDTDHRAGGLVDVGLQTERIAALKAVGDVVVNARVDVREDALDDGLARARRYRDAGADCIYPIFVAGEDAIRAFVDAAEVVNVYLRPTAPSLDRLREIGVRRISVGGSLMRAAMKEARRIAEALRAGDVGPLIA
jgi:2-methylisocitrate lyase-like PEP mutase family enzyme